MAEAGTGNEVKYILSIFIDRASYQPCATLNTIEQGTGRYTRSSRFLLDSLRGHSEKDSSGESTGKSDIKQPTDHLLLPRASQEHTFSEGDPNVDIEFVKQIVHLFFKTEAMSLEITFIKKMNEHNAPAESFAIDARITLDSAAFKSSGRQNDIHERIAKSHPAEGVEAEESKDGITYIQ